MSGLADNGAALADKEWANAVGLAAVKVVVLGIGVGNGALEARTTWVIDSAPWVGCELTVWDECAPDVELDPTFILRLQHSLCM